MWWLHLSGQLRKWGTMKDVIVAKTDDVLDEVVNVDNNVEFLSPESKNNSKGKRMFAETVLMSPSGRSALDFAVEDPELLSPERKRA